MIYYILGALGVASAFLISWFLVHVGKTQEKVGHLEEALESEKEALKAIRAWQEKAVVIDEKTNELKSKLTPESNVDDVLELLNHAWENRNRRP